MSPLAGCGLRIDALALGRWGYNSINGGSVAARIGQVLYGTACAMAGLAVVIAILGLVEGLEIESVGTIASAAVTLWLFGRACRYYSHDAKSPKRELGQSGCWFAVICRYLGICTPAK